MRLLIDGYNFLAASGVFPRGAATFARTRTALLDFLASALSKEEATHTTIVFDAAAAPPGLPQSVEHKGLHVRFAPKGKDADDVIEELIKADSAPKRLTVVSSDHRIQRAAKRRKARAVDSDVFRSELARRPREPANSGEQAKPGADANDTSAWLAIFGADETAPTNDDSPFPPGFGAELDR